MVIRKNLKSNALISVYDKSNLKKICSILKKYNIGIISTGGTATKIKSLGFKCEEISNVTKFKEILDGRVKTLHPKIHASLLFKRNNTNHEKIFKSLNFPRIDFIIVNLYPFSTMSHKVVSSKKIEMIDIGGPSMIRSASKNFNSVTTICDRKYYKSFINELEKNNGETTLSFRKQMAKNNFKLTSDYDLSIFKWFDEKNRKKARDSIKIKYGENPNQKAYFVKSSKSNIIDSQINGKNISYNNILDISEGLNCVSEFIEPTCVILKHNNPSGVASSNNIQTAYVKALASDPVSAFGGTIILNRNIDENLAKIINHSFFEVLVAPKFSKKSLEVLKLKKNLIIINSANLKLTKHLNLRSVNSGTLFQETNTFKINKNSIRIVTKKRSSKKIIDDLLFAFKVAKHVKSNAIILAKNKQTLGIGAGQMSRIDSIRIAILKYKDFFKDQSFVCASDAFFPFTDSIKTLKKYKCKAIIQPGGSKNDNKIIEYSDKNGISLYFSNTRVFKH